MARGKAAATIDAEQKLFGFVKGEFPGSEFTVDDLCGKKFEGKEPTRTEYNNIYYLLRGLVKSGHVKKVSRGTFKLAGEGEADQTPVVEEDDAPAPKPKKKGRPKKAKVEEAPAHVDTPTPEPEEVEPPSTPDPDDDLNLDDDF